MAGGKKSSFGRAVRGTLFIFATASAMFVILFAASIIKLDAWHELDPSKINGADRTLIMYDADGGEITRLHLTEDRVPVSIDDIPLHVRYAFISAEDARFYEHPGVDLIRILGAAWEDIKAGAYVQGASTISQQLIKLSHLTSDKTISRKLEEAVLAYQMEICFSKDEILEMYLNYVYLGGGYYGIEAASLGYFGVHASQLTTAQAAMLAGILKSPSRYSPHLDIAASTGRRDVILGLMYDYGRISYSELIQARNETPVILHDGTDEQVRGYYVDASIKQALGILGISADELYTGGYRIYTAMDPILQSECEGLFNDAENFPSAEAQGAIVIMRVHDGGIAAMVGGRGEYVPMGFNRATGISRQPGSVIKPIISYAPALEYCGYTAASMILDEQTDFSGWIPDNAGNRYYGWVTLREAVTRSLNIPAVKVLRDIGLSRGMGFAESLGIQFDEADASLTLALGGFTYGVSPVEVAGAYSAFANGGCYSSPTLVTMITNASGEIIYSHSPSHTRIMSEQNAFILTSMLESVVDDGTGRRLGELEIPLAGKTGTVSDAGGNRDAWMAAYNPEYTAAVWIGCDTSEHSLPEGATGGKYPALLLKKVFERLYEGRTPPSFSVPHGVSVYKLDMLALQSDHEVALAGAFTPSTSVREEYFVDGTQPLLTSPYWNIPSAPRDFTVTIANGEPVIAFTAFAPHIRYDIYRDARGTTRLIASISGQSGAASYTDTDQLDGSISYYVQPVHTLLTVNGKEAYGPSTKRITVELIPVMSPDAAVTLPNA